MNKLILGLIHTVQITLGILNTVCDEIIPEAELIQLLDEGFLRMLQHKPAPMAKARERLLRHIYCLEENEVDVILVVCSSLSSLVDKVKSKVNVPLVKIDEEMIKRAVECDGKIGILASHELAIDTIYLQIEDYARSIGVNPELKVFVEPNTLIAMNEGDIDRLGSVTRQRIEEIQSDVDILVLAQVSLSVAMHGVDIKKYRIPVLTSPQFAVEKCKSIVQGMS